MVPRRSDPGAQVPGMSRASNSVSDEMVPLGGAGPAGQGTSPRKVVAKVKNSISREEASLFPVAIEGLHWRREEAPAHSKSGSAVTRCLMLTDPSCITFSRRNYLEDHFRVVHKLNPSKPRVGRKKISNKPSRCISPNARERMADHMQGDFPFKFWKAKKKRFVMSTTKAKHMWCSVNGHEQMTDDVRREWIWRKAADFYRIWREGPLALDTMVNLASHVEDYWNGKGIVNEEEVARKGRIPRNYQEFVSDEESPMWEINKDGREICRRRLKSKAIGNKPAETPLARGDGTQMLASGEIPDSDSDEEMDASGTNVAELPSVACIKSLDHHGIMPGPHDSGMGTELHMHRQAPQNCSMQVMTPGRSSLHDDMHGSFTSLLNVVTEEDSTESHHLMSMNSLAMASQRTVCHHEHRGYERKHQEAKV